MVIDLAAAILFIIYSRKIA